MDVFKIGVCACLAHVLNKEINPYEVEIESAWFEPDGKWRCTLVYQRAFHRITGGVGDLFNGPRGLCELATEEAPSASDGGKLGDPILVPISSKGVTYGSEFTHEPGHSYEFGNHRGEVQLSEIWMDSEARKKFRQDFNDAYAFEVRLVKK